MVLGSWIKGDNMLTTITIKNVINLKIKNIDLRKHILGCNPRFSVYDGSLWIMWDYDGITFKFDSGIKKWGFFNSRLATVEIDQPISNDEIKKALTVPHLPEPRLVNGQWVR